MDKRSKLLIVGIDNYSLAYSVKKAGYQVFVADYFGDLDVKKISRGIISVINQKPLKSSGFFIEKYNPELFIKFVKCLSKNHEFKGILLTSGLDDSYEVLSKLDDECNIIGNSPETIRRVRDKEFFFKELDRMNIVHPRTAIISSYDALRKFAQEWGYPIILKPKEGFAGAGIRKIKDKQQLEKEYKQMVGSTQDEIIVQEYIKGTATSISFIASYPKSQILSLNEQLLGLRQTYQLEPFGYCGNITPYLANNLILKKCRKIVNKITSSFNLLGSNGIDLVISEENVPHVIEVNPRFQGSLGCIESSYGINITQMHLEACTMKKVPSEQFNFKNFSTRLILYAPKRVIAPDLLSNKFLSDLPYPHSIIEKGEPICSINTTGETKEEALSKAYLIAKSIILKL
jgi:predicted ATP-grasp superfamily ATP-dependent carboligase